MTHPSYSRKESFCLTVSLIFVILLAASSTQGAEGYILKLESNAGVMNNPPSKTLFTVTATTHITKIFTYHYNDRNGAPGSGTIGLKNAYTGAVVGVWNVVPAYHGFDSSLGGTWPATGDGPPYYYRYVQPNVDIPAGTYEVVDSSPGTWSYNSDTHNMGIAWVYGYDAASEAPAAPGNLRYTFNGTMLTISWDGVSGAAGYKLGLGVGSKANWADYNIGSMTQIGPFDASGIPGTYYLAVKAYSGTQESAYSNEITIPILPGPQNLRYTLNGTMLTISWDGVSGAAGYKLGLGVRSKANWADYNIGSMTQIGPFDSSSIPGTYYLAVRAYSGTQDSAYSNELTVVLGGDTPEGVLQRVLGNQARGDLEAMYPDIVMGYYGAQADDKTKEILSAVKASVNFSGLSLAIRATLYDRDRTMAFIRLETSVSAANGAGNVTAVNGYLAVLVKQDGGWKVLMLIPDDLLNLEIAQRKESAAAPADRTVTADNPLSAAELNQKIDEIFRNPDLSVDSAHALETLKKHPLNYIPFIGTASNIYDAVKAGDEALESLWQGLKGSSDSMTVGIVKIGEVGAGIVSILTGNTPLTQVPADAVKEVFEQLAIYKQKLIALRGLRGELARAQNSPDIVLSNLRLIKLNSIDYAGQGFELTEEGAEPPFTVRKVKVLSSAIGNPLALKLVGDMYISSAENGQKITDYLSLLGLDISSTKGDILTELRQPAEQICAHCDKIVDNFHNDTKVWWNVSCNKGYDSFNIRLKGKTVQTQTVFPLEVTTFMNDPLSSGIKAAQSGVCQIQQGNASCYGYVTVIGTYNVVTTSGTTKNVTGTFSPAHFGAPYGSSDILATIFQNSAVTTQYANSSISGTLTVRLDSGLLVQSFSVASSEGYSLTLAGTNIPLQLTYGPYAVDGHTEKLFYVGGPDACSYIQSMTAVSAMTKAGDLTLTGYSCDAASKLELRCYFYP